MNKAEWQRVAPIEQDVSGYEDWHSDRHSTFIGEKHARRADTMRE